MSEPLSCTKTCANCIKSGLAILPVRYTPVPQTMASVMPSGITGPGVLDVPLTAHRYSLRTLREGWLYLFYERGARGKNYWEVYNVTADGRLWKQALPLPATPKTDPVCAQTGGAVPMDVIAIEQPRKASTVFIAFSEYMWADSILTQYASNATLRAKRMQTIKPSAWISSGSGTFGGANGEHGHAAVATQESIDKVVEYQPGFDSSLLNPPLKPINVDGDGKATDASIWNQEATRYPLHIRQTSPNSASADLVKLMTEIGETTSGTPHKPMLFALWDGVGAVHELTGFYNDPASMIMTFVSQQGKRVDAVQLIDIAERAVRSGAARSESVSKQATAAWMLSGYQGVGYTAPSTQKMIDDAAKLTPAEANAAGEKAWATYISNLKGGAWPNVFKSYLQQISARCTAIQGSRAPDVDAWLSSEIFLDTLNDYDPTDVGDGLAFLGVIDVAFSGLSATAQGQAIIEPYIQNMTSTDPRSYFWRAFGYNQTDILSELNQYLQQVRAKQSESIIDQADSWYDDKQALFATMIGYLKSFAKFYEKMEDVVKHRRAVSATESLVKAVDVDSTMVWAGKVFLKVLGPIGGTTGGALIKGALLVRGGLAMADVKNIIATEAAWTGTMRRQLIRAEKAIIPEKGDGPIEIRAKALEKLADEKRGVLLREQYAAAKIDKSDSVLKALGAQKLYGTLLVIELLNFYATATKPHKTAADYWSVGGGVISLTGACLAVPTKWLGAFYKEGAKTTLANMKVAASYLGGLGSFISLGIDSVKSWSNFSSGDALQGALYTAKATNDAATSVVSVLTALTSSASILIKSTTNNKVRFLGRVALGVVGNQARIDALAAGADAEAARVAAQRAAGIALINAGAAVSEEMGARAAMLAVGRLLVIASGWEISLIVLAITIILNHFTPNDLQNWFSRCVFGTSPWSEWDSPKQRAEFFNALNATNQPND